MLPTIGHAVDGCDGYVRAMDLPTKNISRRWLYRGNPRSVQWKNGGVVKSVEPFTEHPTAAMLTQLLIETAARDIPRPSSYGSLFHDVHYQPPMANELRKMFPKGLGAWQQLRGTDFEPTTHPIISRDPVWLYDVKSAYLWALSQGLPHPDTFRAVKKLSGPGLYWCRSPAWPMLPYPWGQHGVYPVTTDELHRLPIPLENVGRGIIFTPDTFDTSSWVRDIQSWSCHKAVARAFWGRWIAADGLRWETFKHDAPSKQGAQPDYLRNPVWGCLLTARLRMRLWDVAQAGGVLRVHVDSVVLTRQIVTGDKLGDWVEKGYWGGASVITHNGVTLAVA